MVALARGEEIVNGSPRVIPSSQPEGARRGDPYRSEEYHEGREHDPRRYRQLFQRHGEYKHEEQHPDQLAQRLRVLYPCRHASDEDSPREVLCYEKAKEDDEEGRKKARQEREEYRNDGVRYPESERGEAGDEEEHDREPVDERAHEAGRRARYPGLFEGGREAYLVAPVVEPTGAEGLHEEIPYYRGRYEAGDDYDHYDEHVGDELEE